VLSELEFKLLFYNYVVELNEQLKLIIISLAGLWLKESHRLLTNIFWSCSNYFWGSLAVIKPYFSCNFVKPATAENYLASRN